MAVRGQSLLHEWFSQAFADFNVGSFPTKFLKNSKFSFNLLDLHFFIWGGGGGWSLHANFELQVLKKKASYMRR